MLPFALYFGTYLSLMAVLFGLYKNADRIESYLEKRASK